MQELLEEWCGMVLKKVFSLCCFLIIPLMAYSQDFTKFNLIECNVSLQDFKSGNTNHGITYFYIDNINKKIYNHKKQPATDIKIFSPEKIEYYSSEIEGDFKVETTVLLDRITGSFKETIFVSDAIKGKIYNKTDVNGSCHPIVNSPKF